MGLFLIHSILFDEINLLKNPAKESIFETRFLTKLRLKNSFQIRKCVAFKQVLSN